ncbi:MAG: 2OG-Fe(II) oxygenase [Solirubrobacteraceae bacterium]
MASAALLARFGIFVRKGLLDPDLCQRLSAEMRSASRHPATVRAISEDGVADEVDEEHRRTQMAEVSEASVALIEERLLGVKPALEEHFSMQLSTLQPPQFLVYREGDFFRAHIDNASERLAGDRVARRRLSVVMFVNSGESEYGGGALTFYGLLDQDARGESVGIPLAGAPGLFVAFRSGTVHSVTPVTAGERCTVVSWLA